MNTTHEPIPLFGDDSHESTSDAADSTPDTTADEIADPGTPPSGDAAAQTAPADADVTPAADMAPAASGEAIPSAPDAPEVPLAPTAEQTPVVSAPATPPASTPMSQIGSVDDMDAWLSGDASTLPATGAWSPTDAAADAAMAAWVAADPNVVPSDEGPFVVGPGGKVERSRRPREPLVPKWLLWAVAGVLVVAAIAGAAVALLAAHARVIVPTVAGLTTQVARDRVGSVGLVLTVTDRRFSTLPVDTVLSQTPDAGATTTRGSAVTVVVSGGTEDFNMPDVVGQGLALARGQLDQKGLKIQIVVQPSDQPSDTVLSSNPTAGSPMHTGDAVTLTVAQNAGGSSNTSSTLTPFTLSGVKITVDPSAPVSGQPDAALEVARRLQSLLEASGATVLPTRSSADTGTAISATARQARARENTPTVAVGLDVVSSGLPGMVVTYPSSSVSTAAAAPSLQLASQLTSALAGSGLTARQVASGSDVVLAGTRAPYSRITLGTTGSRDDLANFRDANWADKVARALYQAIGSLYGVRNATP